MLHSIKSGNTVLYGESSGKGALWRYTQNGFDSWWELEEGAAGPGTENGTSNRIYEENGYDSKAADEVSKGKIVSVYETIYKESTIAYQLFCKENGSSV